MCECDEADLVIENVKDDGKHRLAVVCRRCNEFFDFIDDSDGEAARHPS